MFNLKLGLQFDSLAHNIYWNMFYLFIKKTLNKSSHYLPLTLSSGIETSSPSPMYIWRKTCFVVSIWLFANVCHIITVYDGNGGGGGGVY